MFLSKNLINKLFLLKPQTTNHVESMDLNSKMLPNLHMYDKKWSPYFLKMLSAYNLSFEGNFERFLAIVPRKLRMFSSDHSKDTSNIL